jgi:hypothetical protein
MRLKDWLKENRYTQTEFRLMMVPPPEKAHFSRLVNGKKTMTLQRALEIQVLTKGKVKPQDWLQTDQDESAQA